MPRKRAGIQGALCLLVSLASLTVGCSSVLADLEPPASPRDAMRRFVVDLASYARARVPEFIVIAQNGDELLTLEDTASDPLAQDYVNAIDGLGREDLFYGYEADNEPTPIESTEWMLSYLNRAEEMGIEVLTIDYCWDRERMDASYNRNASRGFVSFAAPDRMLDVIPDYPVHLLNESAADIHSLSEVENFLALINPWRFESKQAFVQALAQTSYDAVVIDRCYEDTALTVDDVNALKLKANGGVRLVLCYLSIGEAEDYRSYWDPSWSTHPPAWLLDENPDWPGNYPVAFWHSQWQAIVLQMMDAALAAGFDGVYLDRVDVYEQFED